MFIELVPLGQPSFVQDCNIEMTLVTVVVSAYSRTAGFADSCE
jgi:hypothetical protein